MLQLSVSEELDNTDMNVHILPFEKDCEISPQDSLCTV